MAIVGSWSLTDSNLVMGSCPSLGIKADWVARRTAASYCLELALVAPLSAKLAVAIAKQWESLFHVGQSLQTRTRPKGMGRRQQPENVCLDKEGRMSIPS